jgi:hypothetical protein
LHAALLFLHPLSAFLLPWKAGERDARMAIGLWRVDPVRQRGILCALCYLSVAVGKVLLSSFVALLASIIVAHVADLRPKPGGGWLADAMRAIIWAAAASAAGLVVLTFVTSAIAASVRRKIWIDEWADPSTALDGRWPPVSARAERRNIAGLLGVVPSTMIPVVSALIALQKTDACVLFLSAMSGVIPAAWIHHRIAARTPEECYAEPRHPGAADGPIVSVNVID